MATLLLVEKSFEQDTIALYLDFTILTGLITIFSTFGSNKAMIAANLENDFSAIKGFVFLYIISSIIVACIATLLYGYGSVYFMTFLFYSLFGITSTILYITSKAVQAKLLEFGMRLCFLVFIVACNNSIYDLFFFDFKNFIYAQLSLMTIVLMCSIYLIRNYTLSMLRYQLNPKIFLHALKTSFKSGGFSIIQKFYVDGFNLAVNQYFSVDQAFTLRVVNRTVEIASIPSRSLVLLNFGKSYVQRDVVDNIATYLFLIVLLVLTKLYLQLEINTFIIFLLGAVIFCSSRLQFHEVQIRAHSSEMIKISIFCVAAISGIFYTTFFATKSDLANAVVLYPIQATLYFICFYWLYQRTKKVKC